MIDFFVRQLLAIFSLVWNTICSFHFLPPVVCLFVAVIAAGTPLSRYTLHPKRLNHSPLPEFLFSNNSGWRTVFYIVARLALVLLAVSIGQESFSVGSYKVGSQHGTLSLVFFRQPVESSRLFVNTFFSGAYIFAIILDIFQAIIVIALLIVGVSTGSGGDSWTDNIRNLLTPIRNTIAQLGMIAVLVVRDFSALQIAKI